ncbi:MAG TPA: heavy metal-associated domain-containing protein [Opitutaceae bacterium]|nr:heavy metal-associated domain-containing protein [Opitutaceae bacterium]
MKKTLILLAVLGLVPAVSAREIVLTVEGLVCAYCANGIAATAGRDAAIADVVVDLDNALARFVVKPNAGLTAEGAKKIITRAGYSASAVTVTDQSTAANVFELSTLAGGALPSAVTSAYLVRQTDADGHTRLFARLTLERAHAAAWLKAPNVDPSGFSAAPADMPLGWTPGSGAVRRSDTLFGGRPTLLALDQPDDHTTVLYLEITI